MFFLRRTTCVSLPAHPHAGLAGLGWRELGRGGALCRQHLSSLAGDVTVQLGELVQVHDTRRFHHARLLVDLAAGGGSHMTINIIRVTLGGNSWGYSKIAVLALIQSTGLFPPPVSFLHSLWLPNHLGHGHVQVEEVLRSHLGTKDPDGNLPQGCGIGSWLHLKQQVLRLPSGELGSAERGESEDTVNSAEHRALS